MTEREKAIKVLDGNTFSTNLRDSPIRLVDFHIPEPDGEGGRLAKQALEDLILNKTVEVKELDVDGDGARLATVMSDGFDVSEAMNERVEGYRNDLQSKWETIAYFDSTIVSYGGAYENWFIGASEDLAMSTLISLHNVLLPDKYFKALNLEKAGQVTTEYAWSDDCQGDLAREIVDYFIDTKGTQGKRVSTNENPIEVYLYMVKHGTRQRSNID